MNYGRILTKNGVLQNFINKETSITQVPFNPPLKPNREWKELQKRMTLFPASIYLPKVKNRNTKARCETGSELTINPLASFWCLYCSFWIYFTPYFTASIVNFEQVNADWISVWKQKKTSDFSILSGSIKWDQWYEMRYPKILSQTAPSFLMSPDVHKHFLQKKMTLKCFLEIFWNA